MVARVAGWLVLTGVYAVAQLTLDAADPSLQEPLALDALEGDPRIVVLAASAALAFVLAARLAREWVPDPWATRAALAAALSPAGFALSTSAAAPAAALLVAGLLGALRTRDHPTRLRTLGGAGCLALVPWFGLAYAVAAAGVLVLISYWSFRRGRRLYAFLALEFGGASAVTLGGVDVAEVRGPAAGIEGVLEVLVGAPLLALGVVSVGLVARSRRDGLARAIPAWHDAEVGVGLAALAVGAVIGAALVEPVGPEAGVAAAAALAALALRSFRRIGALVALLTVGLSVWRAVELAADSAVGWL